MSSEIVKVFENEEFGKVRTITIDDEPWFVGKDVAEILGYSNSRKAVTDHVDEDDKKDGVTIRDSIGREQTPVIINESGLYSLILSSKLPSAKRFKHWVTSDVLPTIRKTGGYINSKDLMLKTYFSDLSDEQKTLVDGLLTNIEKQQKKITHLETTNEVLVEDILSWADRNLINAIVRRYGAQCGGFDIAWTAWKKELLYKYGININARITAYRNNTGKVTKPKTLDMITDDELPNALRTAVSMCENSNIDVSDLLIKHKEDNKNT